MKRLMAAVAAVTLALCLAAQDKDAPKPAAAQLAGEWAMSVDTPHGVVQGPLRLKEDGSGVSGTFEAEMFGTLPVKGSLDGKKVHLALEIADAQMTFKLTGEIDGAKMSGSTEMGGDWKAERK